MRRLRAFVYARDEGICQLCDRPVEFTAMTLDRIKPGGKYNRANTWCAHRACNDRKGDTELPRFALLADERRT